MKTRDNSRIGLIAILFFIAAILLAGSMFSVYQVGLFRIDSQRKMSDTLLVLQHLEDFLSLLKDAETGQRGYLLTGDASYLKPYSDALSQVQMELDALKGLALSGALPKDRVEHVAALARQKLAELAQTVQLRRDQGAEAALAVVRNNSGKEEMDEIRAEVEQMRAARKAQFVEASQRANKAASIRTMTFIGAGLLNLLFLGWAFRKLAAEMRLREAFALESAREKEVLATTLESIGDGVIMTDAQGQVTFLNKEAETLCGLKTSEAAGQPLPNVFRIINESTRQAAENPAEKALRLGTVTGLANHTLLVAKDGREIPIDDSAAPIRRPEGPLFGVVLVFRDVTEERKAQKASALLAAVVKHSGDAIVTKNLDGIIQTWNAGAEQLFGYKAEEIIGKHVTTLFPADRLSEEDHILETIKQGQSFGRIETLRLTKDGRAIPVSIVVSPLKDKEGCVVGASKIIRDMREVAAAREALAREKELLGTTLASIGDGVITTDAHGRVMFMNGEAERLTGWKNHEAAGQPLPEVFRIVNEQTRQTVENPVEKVLRLGTVVGLANHTVLLAKDGREIPIDDSGAPIRSPKGPLFGVVLVFRDFTVQKEHELRLNQQAQLLDLSSNTILVRDLQDRITYWNKGAQEAYGFTREEALGKATHELLGTEFPEPLEMIIQRLHLDNRWSGEVVHTTRDGRRITDASRWALLRDAHGQPLSILEINLDITGRKQDEEKLREAHEQLASRAVHLEKLVELRTSKLNDTIGDLETFSSSLVHDLRGPLRAMQNFARLLADECGPISATAHDYVARITTAAERMDRLIQEVLNYSRVAREELRLTPLDAGALLRSIIATYPAFQTPHAEVELDGNFPLVPANEAALTQCISNLLGNAVKFVAPGVTPCVRVWAETRGDRVRLLFKDNGIGIEKDAHERIFQMFQRLSKRYEGTGIGLTIVKKAIGKMGGNVGLESEPGKGSTFWLELNLASDERSKNASSQLRNPVS
jgi:PAS domain S-box-containing protein